MRLSKRQLVLICIKSDAHCIEKILRNRYMCVSCTTSVIGHEPPPCVTEEKDMSLDCMCGKKNTCHNL